MGDGKRRILWILVVVVVLGLSSSPAESIGIDVTTEIPDYLLDGNFTLSGISTDSIRTVKDDSNGDFLKGNLRNLTVENGELLLKPKLNFTTLNNGTAVLKGDAGKWDEKFFPGHYVLKHNGTYYLYYSANTKVSVTGCSIGLATSKDCINWTKHSGNPVIKTESFAGDDTHASRPVVIVENGKWHMFYSANNGSDYNVNYAYSNNGTNWTRYANNPVIKGTSNTYTDMSIRPANVYKSGGTYYMYFYATGSGGRGLCLATSNDLTTWSMHANNPLRQSSGGWEKVSVWYGSLERASGTYRIWSCSDYKIGWVWSKDGLKWYDSGAAVLSPEAGTNYSYRLRQPRMIVKDGDHILLASWKASGSTPRTIGAFNVTVERMIGNFTKSFDLGREVNLLDVDWSTDVSNGSSIDLYCRWGNSTSNMTPWLKPTKAPYTGLKGTIARYFEYRAEFRTPQDWLRTTLKEYGVRYTVPLERISFNINDGPWKVLGDDPYIWHLNLTLDDGDHRIGFKVEDTEGRTETRYFDLKVDLYPPTGNITIEDGAWGTNSTQLDFLIQANDKHPITDVMTSFDPDMTGATWEGFQERDVISYHGPDGLVTLYVSVRDAAGRVSGVFNDTIIVDTTPPIGNLSIDSGAELTNTTQVSLTVEWFDLIGVVGMMVSNDPNFTGAEWMDPLNEMNWTMGGGEGLHDVHVRIIDAAGWTSTLVDNITLDTTAPTASIVINDGATYTTTGEVELDISFSDMTPCRFKLTNGGDEWPDEWSTLGPSETIPWSLAAGEDGHREVRLLVMDIVGHAIIVSDDIVFDTGPPEGDLIINGGSLYTNLSTVQIRLDVDDANSGVQWMRVTSSGYLTGIEWVHFEEAFAWTFDGDDGLKTVTAELKDGAGLTTIVHASITLDTKPPEGSFTIGVGETYSTVSTVTLLMEFSDENCISEYRISREPTFTSIPWIPYEGTTARDLGSEEGMQTLFMEVRDPAGNVFTTAEHVILDLADPQVSVQINGDAEVTMDLRVAVDWTALDNVGLFAYRFSDTPDFEGSEWTYWQDPPDRLPVTSDFQNGMGFTFSSPDGDKTFFMQVMDRSGRVTTGADSIWYVSALPDGLLRIGDGSGWVNEHVVGVSIVDLTGSLATHARFSTTEEGLALASWEPLEGTYTILLEGPDGIRAVYAQLLGPHDVTSNPFWAEFTLDTTPPALAYIAPLASNATEVHQVFIVSVTDDIDPSPRLEWRIGEGAWQPLEASSFEVELAEGENRIETRATDAAGNSVSELGVIFYTAPSEPEVTGSDAGAPSWTVIAAVIIVGAIAILVYLRRRGGVGR